MKSLGAPPQGTGGHGISVHRVSNKPEKIEHIFISCLEIKLKGDWEFDPTLFYRAVNLNNEISVVELNGTRKIIKFKKGAYVTILPTNVLTYEGQDEEESIYVDEDEQTGGKKNPTVI